MLISHRKNFIFIHTYKVAGTSIWKALADYCDFSSAYRNPYKRLKLQLGLIPRVFSNDFPRHISADKLKEETPEVIFENYFKFAFVRNPWDWQVSLYHFALADPTNHHHELISNFKSFEEYIEWRVLNLTLQKEFLFDQNDKLLVDFVGKYENLNNDFSKICNLLKIPEIELPHQNKTIHKPYQEYYSDRSKNLITKAFKEDIETFNYSFDGK